MFVYAAMSLRLRHYRPAFSGPSLSPRVRNDSFLPVVAPSPRITRDGHEDDTAPFSSATATIYLEELSRKSLPRAAKNRNRSVRINVAVRRKRDYDYAESR